MISQDGKAVLYGLWTASAKKGRILFYVIEYTHAARETRWLIRLLLISIDMLSIYFHAHCSAGVSAHRAAEGMHGDVVYLLPNG